MPITASYWIERLRFSLRERGAIGTVEKLFSVARRAFSASGADERNFDKRFGVDTAGRIGQHEVGVRSRSVAFAVEYRPTPIRDFNAILDGLQLEYARWSFVDLGSGKGRALLLASHYPFRQIFGVEFSAELTAIARTNVAAYLPDDRQGSPIELVCMDAAEFELPDGPVVVYMNNPFHGEIMKRVINNISRKQKAPGELIIIYWNPFCADMLEQCDSIELLRRGGEYKLYVAASR